jgi:hypothetical protein
VSACVAVALGVTAIAVAATRQSDRTRVTVIDPGTTTTTTQKTTPACTHATIAHVRDSYSGLPAVGGTSIDFVAPHTYAPADDGHGDTIKYSGLSVVESRPDGTVTLTHGDSHNVVVLRGFGDFDGDGLTDLLVALYESGLDTATYVVPGTVPPGTHDPAAVGVRVPRRRYQAGEFQEVPATVGDQNGDGADDVSFGSMLFSGRLLMSDPVGAVLPAPFRTLAAPYVGLLQLDPKGQPTFVIPDVKTSSLEVLDDRSDRLLVGDGSGVLATAFVTGATARGSLVNGHHIVVFGYGTRSGATEWRWDLDAPCGPAG